MDFQQYQCKKLLKLWLDLKAEKKFETTVGFATTALKTILETMARFVRGKKV